MLKYINTILLFIFVSSCIGTKGIISFQDSVFSNSPHIINVKSEWFMKFIYSENSDSYNYLMLSSSFVKEDSLIFYIPVTSSSVISREILQLEPINSTKKIQCLKLGKVFWLQRDGKRVQMAVHYKDSLTYKEYKGITKGHSH